METLIFLAIMMALFWGFLILPQQRRQKRHTEMVASLAVGDEILITAGIYGTITEVFDDDIFLEVAPGVEIRVASGAVAAKIEFEDTGEDTGEGTGNDDSVPDGDA